MFLLHAFHMDVNLFLSLWILATPMFILSYLLLPPPPHHHTLAGTIVLVINVIGMIVNSISTVKVGFWTYNITNQPQPHIHNAHY